MTDEYEDFDPDANPHATFNRVVGGVQRTPSGWAITLRYEHTETGAERREVSRLRFDSEHKAEAAANKIVREIQKRIGEG